MTKREILTAAKKRAALCDDKEVGAAFVRQVERAHVRESRLQKKFDVYRRERKSDDAIR